MLGANLSCLFFLCGGAHGCCQRGRSSKGAEIGSCPVTTTQLEPRPLGLAIGPKANERSIQTRLTWEGVHVSWPMGGWVVGQDYTWLSSEPSVGEVDGLFGTNGPVTMS